MEMKRVKFRTVGHLAAMAGVKELDIEFEGSTIRGRLMRASVNSSFQKEGSMMSSPYSRTERISTC